MRRQLVNISLFLFAILISGGESIGVLGQSSTVEQRPTQQQSDNVDNDGLPFQEDVNALMVSHVQKQLAEIAAFREAVARGDESMDMRRQRVFFRPIQTLAKLAKLCQEGKSQLPGCEPAILKARQKREQILRSNLAALLSGLRNSRRIHTLRMPSLRFG